MVEMVGETEFNCLSPIEKKREKERAKAVTEWESTNFRASLNASEKNKNRFRGES